MCDVVCGPSMYIHPIDGVLSLADGRELTAEGELGLILVLQLSGRVGNSSGHFQLTSTFSIGILLADLTAPLSFLYLFPLLFPFFSHPPTLPPPLFYT